jgi:hypothetical protein
MKYGHRVPIPLTFTGKGGALTAETIGIGFKSFAPDALNDSADLLGTSVESLNLAGATLDVLDELANGIGSDNGLATSCSSDGN